MYYSFGDYELDTQCHELHRAGVPIKLRRKVFQVLAYLLAHRDRVVPKQELLAQLWPDQFVGDEALTSSITSLRRALGERGRTARFVRTLHGQGYRFVGAVAVGEPRPSDEAPQALPWRRGDGAPRRAEGPTPALSPGLADLGSPPRTAVDEEHKQVTVLCGALYEASTVAMRIGPEAMHHLMHDVLALAQDTVQHYEGTLAQVSSEGFVALFGAPVAQEDHARRAVLAAIELRQRLHLPNTIRGQLQGVAVRLGLHTGPVVVGPVVSAPQLPYIAAGETLRQATQLQQRAAPDTILVSAATYALVQGEVQGEVCETLALDGSPTPGTVYTIHGFLRRRAGVPRPGARPLSRFVGRTQELALLHARLAQALGGHGQVIGIVGEPGLGKSRLLAEFVHRLRTGPVTYCEGHCLAYSRATPYLPVRDLLRQLWALPDAAPAAAITATVQQRLCEAEVASEVEAFLLLQFLDVPVDLAPVAALDPSERQARTFALLWHVIRQASRQLPLILAVENLHWIDPTSEAWLTSLVERLADIPVLLLTTYRPGYQPPWLRHSAATQMALPQLSPRDSLVVLQSVPQATQLPTPLQQTIVAKAAGNPFFVEELTWAAVEHGDRAGSLPLPDTIEAVLAARLDRLPPEAKRLAQTAAVIGTEVPVPLVYRVAGLPEDVLQRGLAHLQATEFLHETHLFPEQAYTFKHALTREVAYGSLLHERRRALHAQILDALETLCGDGVGEQVERLAYHALRGEVWDKAVPYCQQAGARAFDRAAFREAATSFEQALQALMHLPEDGDTRVLAIDLRLALAHALRGEHGRKRALMGEAAALARALDDRGRLGRALAAMAEQLVVAGDFDGAIAAGQEALELAAALGDRALRGQAFLRLGQAYNAICPGRAAELLRWSVEALDREAGTSSVASRIDARALLVLTLGDLGTFAEGRRYGEEALRLATVEGRGIDPMNARSRLGRLYLAQGDLEHAIPVLEQGVALCRASGDWSQLRPTVASLGYAYALQGRLAEGRTLLEEGIREGIRIGGVGNHARWVAWLSEVCRLMGHGEEAWQHARQALDVARQLKNRGDEALALHQLGAVYAHADPPEVAQAEAHYQQALALAEELGMRPLMAHCHHGLGRLYSQTGHGEQARAALTTAIEFYRAMEMSFWLPQAEAALAEGHDQG